MVARWISTGIVEAEKKFSRVRGERDIKKLVRVLGPIRKNREATTHRVA